MTSEDTAQESFKEPKKWRMHHLAMAKRAGRKLTMITAYDALTAPIFEEAGVDMILVGDSYGNVQLGYGSTIPVLMEDMERATAAVARSVNRPIVVADLPFGAYEADSKEAFDNAVRLIRVGANAVKLEGGAEIAHTVALLTQAGIPVVGHLGFTPQSENALGGPRMQGRGEAKQKMIDDALALQAAGAVAIVLELVPSPVAKAVTDALHVPTIGIGAGPDTDGQVLVWADMAGMCEWVPSFVKKFANLRESLKDAVSAYTKEVKDGSFPGPDHYKTN
ncbi:3-methyl-2-oxobutanoate hydroxymethyltransferase [Actinomyces urinae]|uniref:3-methyl-2-oxobutanoate hydroxymethyltransferase n=1 Tax=Actinomyces urinae TaxID=1689268 RepID=UPI000930E686|nr:3-methyl-2-oxobutanoate hydroxymethyltransferase [Actinomyces urinae]